ncbi:hypothetical protein H8356DRAFT_1428253 [Neocallimastix lanati (nom. inval.)]|nr:hypothetical protein H8356DRAFT_1428253 [Neocallimastix sp. JGI-2020a]
MKKREKNKSTFYWIIKERKMISSFINYENETRMGMKYFNGKFFIEVSLFYNIEADLFLFVALMFY